MTKSQPPETEPTRPESDSEDSGRSRAELAAALAAAEALADERLAGWQRARADYENLRKRSAQEVRERVADASAGLLRGLLSVVDDFERALDSDDERDPAAWMEGIRLIQRNLYQFLEAQDVRPIAAAGQRFDPAFHEAVGEQPGPSGDVVAQIQKGYVWGRRVLRPAQVIVGRAARDEAAGGEAPDEVEPAGAASDSKQPPPP